MASFDRLPSSGGEPTPADSQPAEEVPSPARGRVLGIDLGSVRIGLALSDVARSLASPKGVLHRGASRLDDHRRIKDLVEEYGVTEVIVGLPLSLSGERTAAARAVEAETAMLREVLTVPVHLVDERLSTVEANARRSEVRRVSDAARRRGRGGIGRTYGRPGASRRPAVDDLAAAVVLQSYLDRSGEVNP